MVIGFKPENPASWILGKSERFEHQNLTENFQIHPEWQGIRSGLASQDNPFSLLNPWYNFYVNRLRTIRNIGNFHFDPFSGVKN
jgi:hypothetical protein